MSTTLTPTPPPKMGRPSTYTVELGLVICQELAAGRSLREICEADDLPNRSTVFTWLHRDPQFRAMYIAARECGAEALADEVIDMALSATAENANAVRVAVDAAKWACAKFSPKRWSDRLQAELSGPGGGPVQIAPAVPMVPSEVGEAVQKLLADAEQAAGLPSGDGSDAERLQRVMLSGSPLHPRLWAALRNDSGGGHD